MASTNSDTYSNTKLNGPAADYKNKIQSFEETAADKMHRGMDKMSAMGSDAAASVSDYVKTSQDFVQQNPIKGIAIAASVGIVAGALLSMALRRKTT